MARPGDFAALPLARSATRAWIDWRSGDLTAHDGLIRPGHPVLLRRPVPYAVRQFAGQAASRSPRISLDIRVPLEAASETEEPMTLDALAFGELLHEILQEAVTRMEDADSGGIAGRIQGQRSYRPLRRPHSRLRNDGAPTRPVPPPVIWRRKCEEARELAVIALTRDETPLPGQRTWSEIPFGSGGRAKSPRGNGRTGLPWDPSTPVYIDGTQIRIRWIHRPAGSVGGRTPGAGYGL